ncbi:MAG: RNA polymerase sigma factor [Akkermansiaceae bacterium]|jgi:RNA polymerase sigma factor (sigma-70 family)|nr:sigma-70 family RNA polymerase sigma factor [Luteolibacter sp.]
MTNHSDNELALLWRSGKVDAYNELVNRHIDLLYRYISSRCGVASEVDDICQEVFLEVCLKINNFDPQYTFTAWLYMIAKRKVVDRFRRQKTTVEFNSDAHGGHDSRDPSLILEERESGRNAWAKVFEILSESQAMALWLRVQEQYSVGQIAATMSQSEANVKVLLFRARQRLVRESKHHTPTQYHEYSQSFL